MTPSQGARASVPATSSPSRGRPSDPHRPVDARTTTGSSVMLRATKCRSPLFQAQTPSGAGRDR